MKKDVNLCWEDIGATGTEEACTLGIVVVLLEGAYGSPAIAGTKRS
jgi:hypothetical protein